MQMFPMYSAEIARIKAEEIERLVRSRRQAAEVRSAKPRRPRRKLQVARPLATVLVGVRLAAPADEGATR